MAAGRTLLERCGSRIKVEAVISNSHFSAATAELLFPRVPVSVVRYPVGEPPRVDRASVRLSLGVETEEVVIIQVSRFERWKGHLLLVDALRHIRSKRPWRVWIVGGATRASERKLRAEIEQSVMGFPKGRVTLLGERADVPTLMQAADIFCQPNIGPEPFGLVFVEALAAGLPVVTTRMGGALEIVDESVGIVTDPEALDVARALDSLLENDDLRRSLGELGPGRARELCGPDRAVASLKAALCRGAHTGELRRQTWA
jgi:glycosyltransferase involved in cell wall biosynthesis